MASRLLEMTRVENSTSDQTALSQRLRRLPERPLVGAALALTALALLVIARDQWFWYDEWDFFVQRERASLADLFRPHNEHLTALPLLAYRILYALFGLHSYLPYYAFFLVVHLTAVALLYRLLRVSLVPMWPALAVALVIAFLGSGAQNVLWAWQIGLVGSLAFFLGALLVIVQRQGPRADFLVVALLVGSLLCSGVGVSAVAAAAVARGVQQRSVLAVVRLASVPALFYVSWYLLAGRGASETESGLLESVSLTPAFAFAMVSAAASGLAGLPGTAVGTVLVLAAAAGLVAVYVAAGRLPVVTVGALAMAGLIALTTALLRAAEFGIEQASAGRYVHLGAALLATGLPPLAFTTARGSLLRRAAHATTALAVVMLGANVILLGTAARGESFLEQAVHARFDATAALLVRGDVPSLGQAKLHPELAPPLTVAGVQRLIDEGAVDPPAAQNLDPAELAAAVTVMQTAVEPAISPQVTDPVRLREVRLQDVILEPEESGCSLLTGTGASPQALLSYDGSGRFGLAGGVDQEVSVYQGASEEFSVSAFREVAVGPGMASHLKLAPPVDGSAFLRIDVAAGTTVQLCADVARS
jgi:hypothetical protein